MLIKEFLWTLITHTSNHITFPTPSLGIISVNNHIGRNEKSRNGKSIKITPVTKQNIMKKHQNKTTLSATHIFPFAWSRNMFPAAKILMSTLGLLFNAAVYFVVGFLTQRAPHSCLLQFQLIWIDDLDWSPWVICDQPQYLSVAIFLGLVTQGKEGKRNLFFPVSEQRLFCFLAMQWEGKPQRECRDVYWGHQTRARRWNRNTSPPVSVCGTHTHPLPCETESLEHYRDWKEKKSPLNPSGTSIKQKIIWFFSEVFHSM